MADTVQKLDVEWRVEAAALEILRAVSGLVALMYGADDATRKANIKRVLSFNKGVTPPSLVLYARDFTEATSRTGWYRGGITMTALTYQADDPDKSVVAAIFGYMRGFGQLTDLPSQINDTVAAQAAGSELTCEHAECDGTPYDESTGTKLYDRSLDVQLLVRPSR